MFNDVALSLWCTLPSPDPDLSIARSKLISTLNLSPPLLVVPSRFMIVSAHSLKPPLPYDYVYVGSGITDFPLRPSPWLNPFPFLIPNNPGASVLVFKRFCRFRPDFLQWLSPIAKASTLVCDCPDGKHVRCNAAVIKSLFSKASSRLSSSLNKESYEPICEPCDDPFEDDVTVPDSGFNLSSLHKVNETIRGHSTLSSNPGYQQSWFILIESVRSSPCRVFWEIFAGCAVLTEKFADAGWYCGPPIDILEDESFNLLDSLFLSVIIGLILEGRIALLHVAPPCSSFSWAVNRFVSYAMRSYDYPEGFPELPPHREEKVQLGNAMAEVSLKLCQAQERVHGFWQWEQPQGSLMFWLQSVAAFLSRSGVFHAAAWVCAFGAPWAKPTAVVGNNPCILDLNVSCPNYYHDHIKLEGKGPDGRNWTAIAGPYWPKFAEAWANCWSFDECDRSIQPVSHLSGLMTFSTDSTLTSLLESKEFSPSRHRTVPVISQRVSAALQPTKRALPSLLPEGLGPICHLELALKLVHPYQLPVSLPEHCQFSLDKLKANFSNVVQYRLCVSDLVSSLSESCSKNNSLVMQYVHPNLVPILAPRNLGLIRELSWVTGFDDPRFLIDYVFGMSTVFWADTAPRFVLRPCEPLYPIDSAWKDIDTHNLFIQSRVQSSGDEKLDEASWAKSQAEFDDGSLIGPFFNLDEVQSRFGKVRLLPRFPIWEQHGGAKEPTCRNIDNGLSGGQNALCGSLYTNRPADLDAYVSLIRSCMENFPGQKLLGFTSDFKSAYRQCTANPDHASFWVLTIWNPVHQCQVYGVAAAQLFGCSIAPLNFCRIPDWCAFISSRLFWIAMLHCVDDIMSVEPDQVSLSGNKAWRILAKCCGWNIPDEKSPLPADLYRLLGVMIDLRPIPTMPPIVCMAADRFEKMMKILSDIETRSSLGCAEAGSIFGQLGFSCTQFFGRWGRAKIRPFSRRQHEPHRFSLHAQLRSSI